MLTVLAFTFYRLSFSFNRFTFTLDRLAFTFSGLFTIGLLISFAFTFALGGLFFTFACLGLVIACIILRRFVFLRTRRWGRRHGGTSLAI